MDKLEDFLSISVGFTSHYAILIAGSVILTGPPSNWSILLLAGILVFLGYGLMGIFVEERTDRPTLLSRIDSRGFIANTTGTLTLGCPIAFIIANIPKGVVYTFATMNVIGLVIMLMVLGIGVYYTVKSLLSTNYHADMAIGHFAILIALVVFNGTMKGLTSLDWTGFGWLLLIPLIAVGAVILLDILLIKTKPKIYRQT